MCHYRDDGGKERVTDPRPHPGATARPAPGGPHPGLPRGRGAQGFGPARRSSAGPGRRAGPRLGSGSRASRLLPFGWQPHLVAGEHALPGGQRAQLRGLSSAPGSGEQHLRGGRGRAGGQGRRERRRRRLLGLLQHRSRRNPRQHVDRRERQHPPSPRRGRSRAPPGALRFRGRDLGGGGWSRSRRLRAH